MGQVSLEHKGIAKLSSEELISSKVNRPANIGRNQRSHGAGTPMLVRHWEEKNTTHKHKETKA